MMSLAHAKDIMFATSRPSSDGQIAGECFHAWRLQCVVITVAARSGPATGRSQSPSVNCVALARRSIMFANGDRRPSRSGTTAVIGNPQGNLAVESFAPVEIATTIPPGVRRREAGRLVEVCSGLVALVGIELESFTPSRSSTVLGEGH